MRDLENKFWQRATAPAPPQRNQCAEAKLRDERSTDRYWVGEEHAQDHQNAQPLVELDEQQRVSGLIDIPPKMARYLDYLHNIASSNKLNAVINESLGEKLRRSAWAGYDTVIEIMIQIRNPDDLLAPIVLEKKRERASRLQNGMTSAKE